MDITIYEDQTGLMLFPVEKTEKNIQIVSFFNNNIDLFLEKIGDNLAIYCHLIASKASSRPIGYYVIFKDVYNDQIFSNFKKEINNQSPCDYGFKERVVLRRSTAYPGLV